MNVKVKFNHKNLAAIENIAAQALVKTADAIKTDVQQSQTMPFKTGALQNRSTFVDNSQAKDFKVSVVSDTPYARRLYFHPEYNFYRLHNKNAGGEWFEPYITGEKQDYAQRIFERFMHNGMKHLGG